MKEDADDMYSARSVADDGTFVSTGPGLPRRADMPDAGLTGWSRQEGRQGLPPAVGRLNPRSLAIVGATCVLATLPSFVPGAIPRTQATRPRMPGCSGREAVRAARLAGGYH